MKTTKAMELRLRRLNAVLNKEAIPTPPPLPEIILNGDYLMVFSGDGYHTKFARGKQLLRFLEEAMFGDATGNNPKEMAAWQEQMADLDRWWSDNGVPYTFDSAIGEDGHVNIFRLTGHPLVQVLKATGLFGATQIFAERLRQMEVEGWSPEHDDKHKGKQMAKAAGSYLSAHTDPDEWAKDRKQLPGSTHDWPWAKKWWKPSADPIRNLVKAGALIAAEIDRLVRKQGRKK